MSDLARWALRGAVQVVSSAYFKILIPIQGLESMQRPTALLEDLVEAGKEERQYGQCVVYVQL